MILAPNVIIGRTPPRNDGFPGFQLQNIQAPMARPRARMTCLAMIAQYPKPAAAINIAAKTLTIELAIDRMAIFEKSMRRFNNARCWMEKPVKMKLREEKTAIFVNCGSLKNSAIRGDRATKARVMPAPKSELTQKSALTC